MAIPIAAAASDAVITASKQAVAEVASWALEEVTSASIQWLASKASGLWQQSDSVMSGTGEMAKIYMSSIDPEFAVQDKLGFSAHRDPEYIDLCKVMNDLPRLIGLKSTLTDLKGLRNGSIIRNPNTDSIFTLGPNNSPIMALTKDGFVFSPYVKALAVKNGTTSELNKLVTKGGSKAGLELILTGKSAISEMAKKYLLATSQSVLATVDPGFAEREMATLDNIEFAGRVYDDVGDLLSNVNRNFRGMMNELQVSFGLSEDEADDILAEIVNNPTKFSRTVNSIMVSSDDSTPEEIAKIQEITNSKIASDAQVVSAIIKANGGSANDKTLKAEALCDLYECNRDYGMDDFVTDILGTNGLSSRKEINPYGYVEEKYGVSGKSYTPPYLKRLNAERDARRDAATSSSGTAADLLGVSNR